MDTKQLSEELRRDEGSVRAAYKDSLGYLTIGVGRLIDAQRGGGLSDDEIDYLLLNDIVKVEAHLDERLPWWRTLSETRQRVLANMCFNLGIEGLCKFVHTLDYIHSGRYEDAATAMMQSTWAAQVGLRAKRLALMMRDDHI